MRAPPGLVASTQVHNSRREDQQRIEQEDRLLRLEQRPQNTFMKRSAPGKIRRQRGSCTAIRGRKSVCSYAERSKTVVAVKPLRSQSNINRHRNLAVGQHSLPQTRVLATRSNQSTSSRKIPAAIRSRDVVTRVSKFNPKAADPQNSAPGFRFAATPTETKIQPGSAA